MYLAERRLKGPVTLTEIAEQLKIPKAFLSKILQQLAKKSIVRSLKGPSGGFVLAVDPDEISMKDIMVEIDGPLKVFECFGTSADCNLYGDCLMRDVFEEVEGQIAKVLENYRLSQFSLDPAEAIKAPPGQGLE